MRDQHRRIAPITNQHFPSRGQHIMTYRRQLPLLNLFAAAALIAILFVFASSATADPLPGRDLLKFSQSPMITTSVNDPNGVRKLLRTRRAEHGLRLSECRERDPVLPGAVHGGRFRRQTQQPGRAREMVGLVSERRH